jgi:hypothetical protein
VIVISGALVLVALVLLVLGLTMQDLNFVYGSIGVSLVSFVFLVIGILQRRGEQPQPATAGADVRDDSAPAAPSAEPAAPVPVPVPAARSASRRAAVQDVEEVDDAPEATDEEVGGTVLVVPGRPRYHVEGCRYLTGKQADEVDVLAARGDGFTACGVCKPDAVLEALTAEPVAEIVLVGEQTVEEDTGVPGTEDAVEQVPARARGSRRVAEAEPAAAPAGRAPAKRAARKAPAPVAVAPTAEPAAAPKAKRPGRVVVIPDRGRFHTADCRFVRGVAGTEELTRTQASRGGYQPCGVCKPS